MKMRSVQRGKCVSLNDSPDLQIAILAQMLSMCSSTPLLTYDVNFTSSTYNVQYKFQHGILNTERRTK
jgi:hypothetical protein